MAKEPAGSKGYNLDRPCRTCGRLLRDHIWSRCSCRIYLRPCRELIARIFPEEWGRHVSGDGQTCKLCGCDLADHFEYRVFSVRVMDRVIEEKREISLQHAVAFNGCKSGS